MRVSMVKTGVFPFKENERPWNEKLNSFSKNKYLAFGLSYREEANPSNKSLEELRSIVIQLFSL